MIAEDLRFPGLLLKHGNAAEASGQALDAPVNTLGRLTEVDHFADIIVKTGQDGSIVLMKEIGRVELGAKSYDT